MLREHGDPANDAPSSEEVHQPVGAADKSEGDAGDGHDRRDINIHASLTPPIRSENAGLGRHGRLIEMTSWQWLAGSMTSCRVGSRGSAKSVAVHYVYAMASRPGPVEADILSELTPKFTDQGRASGADTYAT